MNPLIGDPVEIKDFMWEQNHLNLILSRPVSPKWVSALNSMGGHSSLLGKGPEAFAIQGNQATIGALESEVQPIINYFKSWLPLVARRYEQMLKEEQILEQQRKQAELQARIQEEEAKARLRRNIKL